MNHFSFFSQSVMDNFSVGDGQFVNQRRTISQYEMNRFIVKSLQDFHPCFLCSCWNPGHLYPTSPAPFNLRQLLPGEPCLHDVGLVVTSSDVVGLPTLSLALRVPC